VAYAKAKALVAQMTLLEKVRVQRIDLRRSTLPREPGGNHNNALETQAVYLVSEFVLYVSKIHPLEFAIPITTPLSPLA
jgi:hypothetical protein